jgi:triosephosphate isomerase
MLAALRVRYVIVGHSERRQIFGEDDAFVNKKVRAVFKHEMTPILCVGETLEEREADGTESKVAQQIRRGFDNVTAEQAATAVVAYEPIWAIGTGRNAEPADAGRVVEVIRATLADRYDDGVAQAVRVQYGGASSREHPRVHGASGDRRRARGRCQPRSGGPRVDRQVPLAHEYRPPKEGPRAQAPLRLSRRSG